MRKISASEKARMKMDAAIWTHGRKKGEYTIVINKLKGLKLPDKCISEAITLLEAKRKELNSVELFNSQPPRL